MTAFAFVRQAIGMKVNTVLGSVLVGCVTFAACSPEDQALTPVANASDASADATSVVTDAAGTLDSSIDLEAGDGGDPCGSCTTPDNVCVAGTLTYYTASCPDNACVVTLSSGKCIVGCGTQGKGGATCSGTNATGNLDSADDKGLHGWACDPDVPWESAQVHLYFDGPAGAAGAIGIGGVYAGDVSEVAVNDICGGERHRFNFTSAQAIAKGIAPGAHNVWAYAISNATGESNTSINAAPLVFNVVAGAPDAN